MDTVKNTRRIDCSNEVDNGNWITGINAMRFHLKPDAFHHHERKARHCLILLSREIVEMTGMVVNL